MTAPATRPAATSHHSRPQRSTPAGEVDLAFRVESSTGARSIRRRLYPTRPATGCVARPLPLGFEAFAERDLRLPAELGADPRRVGAGAALVAGNRLTAAQVERPARDLLEQRDRLVHRGLERAADVVRAAAALHRRDRPVDDVADIRPAARLRAVAVELEGAAGREREGDSRERHVGPLARPERVEVAQHHAVEAELARVRSREVLAPELRDPVRRERARRRLLGRRVALGGAVDRRRRREDDLHAVAHRSLEDALRREQVPAQVRREDVAEAAHAGLPGEVEHPVGTRRSRRRPRPGRRAGSRCRAPRASRALLLLQRRVVVVGEAVEPDDVVTGGAQRRGKVRPDEPGCAGDDVPHRVWRVAAGLPIYGQARRRGRSRRGRAASRRPRPASTCRRGTTTPGARSGRSARRSSRRASRSRRGRR